MLMTRIGWFFLRTLEEVCRRTGWWVHAYVLMSNHYHLLLETPVGIAGRGVNLGNFARRREPGPGED
jgi:REP element-mobilizing transposase RayT